MNECLLNIVASPAVEESLIDWLLEQPACSGFSSYRIEGHGTGHGQLSLAEQVTGRQRKVMFQLHGERSELAKLVEALREAFRGTGLHYWMTPVLEAGSVA